MQLNYTNFLSITHNLNKIHIDQSKAHKEDIDSFITHSHSDHVVNSKQRTFATKETMALINQRCKKTSFDFSEINYNKKIKINDNLVVTPLNAGHILGSTMFFIEDFLEGKTILYTGDFNSVDSLVLDAAKPIRADILITESTFGKPGFEFGSRTDVCSNFSEAIKRDLDKGYFIILGGYTLGKNQELIYLVNKYLGQCPLVDKETYNYSMIYEDNAIFLGQYNLLDHNLLDHNILILPMNLISRNLINSLSHQLGKNVSSYLATGWNYNRGSKVFHLSDHPDYSSLLEFAREVNPKEVYTMHGFSKELASGIAQKLKVPARPIELLSQKGILDY